MVTLKQKATGAMVTFMQTMLEKAGFTPGVCDGAFGPKTKAAVVAFQKANKLAADGVCGEKTFETLFSVTKTVPGTAHFNFKAEFDRPHRPELAKYYTDCPVKYYANVQQLFFDMETIRAELNRLYAKGSEVKLYTRSGYRGPEYNRRCDGAKSSTHLYGEALDFYAVRVWPDGRKEERVPNCYQVGGAVDKLFKKGGRGLGSNTNVHYDVRKNLARWWYTFKSWAKWKAGQGKAA